MTRPTTYHRNMTLAEIQEPVKDMKREAPAKLARCTAGRGPRALVS